MQKSKYAKVKRIHAMLKKVNIDNYRFTFRRGFRFLSPPDKTLLQSCSFFGCICWSQTWRPWWLHLLWLWWRCYLFFPYLLGLWTCLGWSRFILRRLFIFLPTFLWGLILLVLGWSMSPPGVGLLGLLISGITIEITAYLFSRELEVDLSRSNVDDCVDERSSQYNRCIIFFFTHV